MGRTWTATTGRRLSPRCFLVLNRFEIFVSPLLIVFETSVSPFFDRDLCLSVWALSFPIRLYMPYSIKLGDTLVALFFVGGEDDSEGSLLVPAGLSYYHLSLRWVATVCTVHIRASSLRPGLNTRGSQVAIRELRSRRKHCERGFTEYSFLMFSFC